MDSYSFTGQLRKRLIRIYGSFPYSDRELNSFLHEVDQLAADRMRGEEKWNEQDVILITYGDSIRRSGKKPLQVLKSFLQKYLDDAISYLHILPFYPYSSDDGFSVIDYKQVNPELGDWSDIESLGESYKLMFDLVINHVSQHSVWYRNYREGKNPGKGFFIEVEPGTDLSKVVRPRSLPLLTACRTPDGEKQVWTTFSADQIDLNFGNPDLLLEMLRVFLFYLRKGAKIIRLDAIAFLWKEIGTTCLHLPQTHEVVKLMRDLVDYVDPGIILLTETNVPNKENLSYFGKGDEANMVYQFSLPPLLLHALYFGHSSYLTNWAETLSSIPAGCTFFNFTASHDGIGVRPLEGLMPHKEVTTLAKAMQNSGGHISTKRNPDGTDSPYELNITYLDALTSTYKGPDNKQIERFIASQTLMMSFKGIPAFYIHSLLGTHNDHEGVTRTGMPRSINRHKWDESSLEDLLEKDTPHRKILSELIRRIRIRRQQPAFHPDSPQKVLRDTKELFLLQRGKEKKLLVMANLSDQPLDLNVPEKDYLKGYKLDLLTGEKTDESMLSLDPYQVRWLFNPVRVHDPDRVK